MKLNLSEMRYERFLAIVEEGKIDYIGRTVEYFVSAQIVVERMYPDRSKEFSRMHD